MAYITAAEVKNIRNALKAEFPQFKFSVSGGGSSKVNAAILKGPEDFSEIMGRYSYTDINPYWLQNYGRFEPMFKKMIEILRSQNWYDDSDAMTDYFNTAYYVGLSIGKWNKPYEMVK